MKGYFAFPPPSTTASISAQPSDAEPTCTGACATRVDHTEHERNAAQVVEDARRKRREHERTLGEHSEIEWVRAGGILRDALGRRDMARTERIRQELDLQEVERQRLARWEAYETRWRTMQSSSSPITFVEFPWPIAEHSTRRDLGHITRHAVSGFLFESLSARTSTTTKKERIRNALLRWHPDKISFVFTRVIPDDLELTREGIHVVFGILKTLQDAERTNVL